MKKKRIAQLLLLLCALAFIAIGVTRGEAQLILKKAIRVCLECVGLT